jgi:hypothetical protein
MGVKSIFWRISYKYGIVHVVNGMFHCDMQIQTYQVFFVDIGGILYYHYLHVYFHDEWIKSLWGVSPGD